MRRFLSISLGLIALTCLRTGVSGCADLSSQIQSDTLLRAMTDELTRSKALSLNNLEKPYFIQYSVSDTEQVSIAASLGGILSSTTVHARQPVVQVRVGSYQFDNTHSVFAGKRRLGLLPIDDNYSLMRTDLWLSTDTLYKAATDAITRKKNALREVASPDKTPDLAPAKPIQILEKASSLTLDRSAWQRMLEQVSAVFCKYPDLATSYVDLTAIESTYRVANSEGTVIRIPQDASYIQMRSSAFAKDGHRVWSDRFVTVLQPSDLPNSVQLAKLAEAVAQETEALQKAPVADDYSGPVLFEQQAAAQMMAAVLGDSLHIPRRPVVPANFDTNRIQILDSVWAGRVGAKVVPEWMSIYDDPRQKDFKGEALTGEYSVDDEGVPAERVSLVDKGTLKGFLLSREPVQEWNASNGHGRLPGAFGGEEAVIGNLFIQADKTISERKLKSRLLQKAKAARLQYGILIRKLDYPSTANLQELQSMARQMRKNGSSRTLDIPLLAYRVYPDGHEELIRGIRFKDFSGKDLRDIDAASDQPYVLNYLNNGSSVNSLAVDSEATTSSVICPSLLFDRLDLARAEQEAGTLPLLPPPAPGQ